MSAVSGLLQVGEASRTVRTIAARQRGSLVYYYAILFALAVAGGVVGYLVARFVMHVDGDVGVPFGFSGGAIVYLFVVRRVAIKRFRSRMVQKGHPPDLQLRMEITPEALLYSLGGIRQIADWSAVSELFESRGYWIFLAQSSPYFAPKRFFESFAAEKAFVASALAHMSDDARARSKKAVAFAAS
jgi:hypothetical protein